MSIKKFEKKFDVEAFEVVVVNLRVVVVGASIASNVVFKKFIYFLI